MTWCDVTVETLKRLHKQGLSASKIAERLGMGCTRNAVLGKLWRLGLCEPKPSLPGRIGRYARAKVEAGDGL
jgi:GcrA cell cycle regulator